MAKSKKSADNINKDDTKDVNSTEDLKQQDSFESNTRQEKESAEDINSKNNSDPKEKSNEEEILNNKLLRLQADYLNYKNRTEKEKLSTYNNAVSDLILELLPIIDNFDRALDAKNSNFDSLKQGMDMVYSQFLGLLTKKGLSEIESLHKQFDHNFHYGVMYEENTEYDDGTVIEVLQKGYKLNEKCIRPSMVKVSKK